MTGIVITMSDFCRRCREPPSRNGDYILCDRCLFLTYDEQLRHMRNRGGRIRHSCDGKCRKWNVSKRYSCGNNISGRRWLKPHESNYHVNPNGRIHIYSYCNTCHDRYIYRQSRSLSREVDSSQKFDSKSVSVENRPQGASQAKSLKRTRSISQPEETLSGSRRTKVPRTTSVHPESVSTQLSASYLLASMRNTLLKETKSALLQQMQTSLGEFIVSEQDHFDQLIEEMKGITNNPEVIDTLKSRYRGTGKRFRAYVQTTERLIDRLKDF